MSPEAIPGSRKIAEALTDRLSSKATASTRVACVEFEIKEGFRCKLPKNMGK
jgi:hypothetical protein